MCTFVSPLHCCGVGTEFVFFPLAKILLITIKKKSSDRLALQLFTFRDILKVAKSGV